ncbi:hypothetical protein JNM05_11110 [bacterium]|nr:hypothetical protein [bacterium]
MRTFFSYFFGLVVTFLAVTFIPIERLLDEIMNTQKLVDNVKSANLHENLCRLTVRTIIGQKQAGLLADTSLMPARDDLQEVIKETFPEEWLLNNVSAAHTDLINFMKDPVTDGRFFVGIQLEDRKNLLTENLSVVIEDKINSLPECTQQDLKTMSPGFLTMRKGVDFDIRKLHVTCRPPDEIKKLIFKSIRTQIYRSVDVLPDSLILLKSTGGATDQITIIRELKSLYRFSQSFAVFGYGALLLLLILIATINYGNLSVLLHRIGFPFVLSGMLLSLPFAFALAKSDDVFSISSQRIARGAASVDSVGNETWHLVMSFAKTIMEQYSWNMIYFAVIIFIIGLGFIIWSRILRIKPLSPLDSRDETNL